ncbi:MAG: hypothetical protein R3Y18_04280 [Bacillota bacterium]
MNFSEIQKMMANAEKMRGKSPIDVLSENNPKMAQMRNVLNNPNEMLSKMSGSGNMADFKGKNGMDIAGMMNVVSSMQNNRKPQQNNKIYYGLAPIAGFASAEIVYELNRYLAREGGIKGER